MSTAHPPTVIATSRGEGSRLGNPRQARGGGAAPGYPEGEIVDDGGGPCRGTAVKVCPLATEIPVSGMPPLDGGGTAPSAGREGAQKRLLPQEQGQRELSQAAETPGQWVLALLWRGRCHMFAAVSQPHSNRSGDEAQTTCQEGSVSVYSNPSSLVGIWGQLTRGGPGQHALGKGNSLRGNDGYRVIRA